jgi:hypothetical protein
MNIKVRRIEVDVETADMLEARAAERGLSVSDLIAEMTAIHGSAAIPPRDEIAELDRQWEVIKSGEATVPHEKVVRWLQTWGTPSHRPWNNRWSSNGRLWHWPIWIDSQRFFTIETRSLQWSSREK